MRHYFDVQIRGGNKISFSYFSIKTCVVGTQKNSLNDQ